MTHITSVHSELVEYVTSLNNSNTPITAARFIEDKVDLIINNTPITECVDVAKIWAGRLGRAAKEKNLKLVTTNSEVDWDPIRRAILQKFTEQTSNARRESSDAANETEPASNTSVRSSGVKRSNTSSRNTSSTGSKTDSYLLSLEAIESFKLKHEQFIPAQKWKLSSGTYVEDVMLNSGLELSHEHPVHSYILCVDDPKWKNKFTPEEFQELINGGCPSLPELPQQVQQVLNHLKNAGEMCLTSHDGDDGILDDAMLDQMIKAAHEIGPFNPRSEYEQFWIRSALDQLLGYYATDMIATMGTNVSELDLVGMYWSIFDRCFHDIKIIATRDRTCVASSLRNNEGRTVSGNSVIANKNPSIRPDLLLIRKDIEYGCSELGKAEDSVPTKKEVVETQLHSPKTMKDIFDRIAHLVNYDEGTIRKLRVVCLHQTNRRMKISILDCPYGYVCRVMQSEEYEIPPSPQRIPAQVLPMIELVLQAKCIVQASARLVESYLVRPSVTRKGLKCMQSQADTILLPRTLTLTTQANEKRRRTDVSM